MAKQKKSKAQETVQKYFIKGKTSLTDGEFAKLRVKISNGRRDLGNLSIKKGLLGGYNLTLINSKKDLDGILFSEKTDLLRKLISKWDNGTKSISFDEMKKLNIYTPDTTIKVGNFILESGFLSGSKYEIRLRDTKKDSLGRWIDSEVTISRIITEIKKLEEELKVVKTEKALQKLIYNHLNKAFHSVSTEVSIGDLKTTKIDIEVGKKIGIELKMAKGLKKSAEFQRTIGQITHEYPKKYEKEKLVLIVGGEKGLRASREIKEISGVVKKQKSYFYYLEILSK